MSFKKYRNMKVYEQSGSHYKASPTILLKGQWLKDCNFEIGTPILVTCEDGKLTITKTDNIEIHPIDTTNHQPTNPIPK